MCAEHECSWDPARVQQQHQAAVHLLNWVCCLTQLQQPAPERQQQGMSRRCSNGILVKVVTVSVQFSTCRQATGYSSGGLCLSIAIKPCRLVSLPLHCTALYCCCSTGHVDRLPYTTEQAACKACNICNSPWLLLVAAIMLPLEGQW